MRESKATIISLPKELPEHSTAAGAQKLLCVPFGPGGRIEGGFILADPSEDPAGGKLVLLQLFGELAKAALANALIFEGMEARIQYLLDFDELLTKLPNRRFFKRRLDEAIASSSPTARVALLFLDLDDFDSVNRKFGLSAGDSFLCQAAARLHALTSDWGASCFLGRLGGDEFGIILWPVGEDREVLSLAGNIVSRIDRPALIPSYGYPITVSIGVTLCQQHIDTVETLLWRAQQSMYMAKGAGKNTFHYAADGLCSASPAGDPAEPHAPTGK